MESAHTMMRAASAVIRAGGAGVFIDNCTLAHGGQHWLDMTDDGRPERSASPYVTLVGGETEVYTMGMHALGLRDILMNARMPIPTSSASST